MTHFAAVVLDPASFAAWAMVGVVCGCLAGKVAPPCYGLLGDAFIGTIGGLFGGAVHSFVRDGKPAFWISSVMAMIGACTFIAAARALASGAPQPPDL